MANQDRQLLIDLNTNYPDMLVVIGKTLLGKSSRKKKSSNQTSANRKGLCHSSVCIAEFRRRKIENGE